MLAQIARQNLIKVADAYAAAKKMPRTAVSRQFYGRSDFLDEFRRGKQSISIDKLDEVVRAFRREWPEDAEWPLLPAIIMGRRG